MTSLKAMRNLLTSWGIETNEIASKTNYYMFNKYFSICYNTEGTSEVVLAGKVWDDEGQNFGSDYFEYGHISMRDALGLIANFYQM